MKKINEYLLYIFSIYCIIPPTYTDYFKTTFRSRSCQLISFGWKRVQHERESKTESPLTSFWPVGNLSLSPEIIPLFGEQKRVGDRENCFQIRRLVSQDGSSCQPFFAAVERHRVSKHFREQGGAERERQQSQAPGSEQASEKLAANVFPLKSSSKTAPDVPTC